MVVIRTHGFTELKSGDDLRYERAVDIREPHIATTKAIRQLGMIHSQKVQHRRVQVMGGNRLLHRLPAGQTGSEEHRFRADHLRRRRLGRRVFEEVTSAATKGPK